MAQLLERVNEILLAAGEPPITTVERAGLLSRTSSSGDATMTAQALYAAATPGSGAADTYESCPQSAIV
jgi:hypothetical protein